MYVVTVNGAAILYQNEVFSDKYICASRKKYKYQRKKPEL
jgi:hypothetical protein